MLGVEPTVGRAFRGDEDQPLLKRGVALISHALWQRRFSGDPSVVGRSIPLNDDPFTVLGILPREFHFARIGAPDIFVTLSPTKNAMERRYMRGMWAIGRLREGATQERANAPPPSRGNVCRSVAITSRTGRAELGASGSAPQLWKSGQRFTDARSTSAKRAACADR